jgi:hypothetical protein
MDDRVRTKLFLLKPDIDGCLNWRWTVDSKGYPKEYISIKRKVVSIHRYILSERLKLDYDDKNWVAMHKCNNPYCVNFDHLIVGNMSLNIKHYHNCYRLERLKLIRELLNKFS